MLKKLKEDFDREIISIKKDIEIIRKELVRNEEYKGINRRLDEADQISNLEDKGSRKIKSE